MTTPLQNAESQSDSLTPSELPVAAAAAESAATAAAADSLDDLPSSSDPRPQSGVRRVLNSLLWGSLFVGTAAVAAVAGGTIALTMPLPAFLGGDANRAASLGDLWQAGFRYQVTRPVNILIMGIDEVPNAQPTT
ncbi:MAG: hypothetical protein WBG38_03380, partial [Nodosilinea sp.]